MASQFAEVELIYRSLNECKISLGVLNLTGTLALSKLCTQCTSTILVEQAALFVSIGYA